MRVINLIGLTYGYFWTIDISPIYIHTEHLTSIRENKFHREIRYCTVYIKLTMITVVEDEGIVDETLMLESIRRSI